MKRRDFLRSAGAFTLGMACPLAAAKEPKNKVVRDGSRPNILWISTEDIGIHLGCYSDPFAKTPTLDSLAARGIRYANAFTVAGVCAPNRSCIITGVYQTTLGTQHMRSGGSNKPELPDTIRMFPAYLRQAGYYCTNNKKEDYQVPTPQETWDESGSSRAHWRNRPDESQPFFAVFNFGGTHEGSVNKNPQEHAAATRGLGSESRQERTAITPPPYHPDTPIVRQTWAEYLELITVMDSWVAYRLKELEKAGVAEDTIVFFWSDHGQGMPRCKRWLYDSGTHVPLIVYIPEKWRVPGQLQPGSVEENPVSSIDLAPTVLNLLGLAIPDYMQGQPFLGSDCPAPRQYVYGARDRMDERYDIIRMVRDKRFQYLRNYAPFTPYDQFMNTAEKSVIKKALHEAEQAGALTPGTQWVATATKPMEELYDTQEDPHEIHNLAADPAYAEDLGRLRAAHEKWVRQTRDLGLIPEPELVRLDKLYGSRYAIWSALEKKDPAFFDTLYETATVAGTPGEKDRTLLLERASSPHPSIRWWAIIGLGNLESPPDTTAGTLEAALKDQAGVVRVAAARALFQLRQYQEPALAVLIQELENKEVWVRLCAAQALDAIGDAAHPAEAALKKALKDKESKYVVRVANHALNHLLGTNTQVR